MASASRRLPDNAPGDFFVDDSCIDCGACRWMAPEVFDLAGDQSRVHRQPATPDAERHALEALVACPTASIGTHGDHDVASAAASFPRLWDAWEGREVRHCGFHSADSFGAAAWLLVRPGGNVLVDSPRYSRPLARRLEALGGVRWMFLTHRDDVADHARFAEYFGCERLVHAGDARAVPGAERVFDAELRLADDLLVLPTPGHTRGSACLLAADRWLFTGDTLAWSPRRNRLTAFRDACWFDWGVLRQSIAGLRERRFDWVLPGHGAPGSVTDPRVEIDRCVAAMG